MKTYYLHTLKALFIGFLSVLVLAGSAQTYVSNVNILSNRQQYKYSDRFTDYEVQTRGDIKVSDDDTRIVSISPGG